MLTLLRSGQIAALVMDKPFAEYQAAVSCDLYVVGDPVLPVNLGFAFPPSTSKVRIKSFRHLYLTIALPETHLIALVATWQHSAATHAQIHVRLCGLPASIDNTLLSAQCATLLAFSSHLETTN